MEGARLGLFEALLDASPDAVVVVGEDGSIETVSPAVTALFGYKPEELIGKPVEVLLPESLRESHVRFRQGYVRDAEARPMGANLDLRGRRVDGSVFPVDVSLAPTVVDGGLRVGAFIRDATERRRSESLLRYVNEISSSVLAGERPAELLALTAERGRELLDAACSWIAVRQGDDPDDLVVAASSGLGAKQLLGRTVPVNTSIAARAMTRRIPLSIPDMSAEPEVMPEARQIGLGPGLYQPMLADEGTLGTLVIARHEEGQAFDLGEIAVAEAFASAAAVVLALGRVRESMEELKMMAEHERIGRDLHDTVIQRLFALGMGLQAAERLADERVRGRIGDAVDAIDNVIREIRQTIFDLSRPPSTQSALRHELRELIREAETLLGFTPRLAMRGPVESAMIEQMLPHVVAVVRESLSNTARHARASSVDVVIEVTNGMLHVSVSDDGIGVKEVSTAGHGLENMRRRAEQLGGTFTLTSRSPSGSRLEWTVPAARGD